MLDPSRLRALLDRVAEETVVLRRLAARGLRAPVDFADSFAVLGEAGLLEADLVLRALRPTWTPL